MYPNSLLAPEVTFYAGTLKKAVELQYIMKHFSNIVNGVLGSPLWLSHLSAQYEQQALQTRLGSYIAAEIWSTGNRDLSYRNETENHPQIET